MKRAARWALLTAALAGVAAAITVAPGQATPPSALTNVLLARGGDVSDGTIPLQAGTDVVMSQITVNPGGSSGWHSHPGGAIIVVQQGTLVVYTAVGNQCQTTTYSAGQAFVERPGEVDNVLDQGTEPLRPSSSPSRVCPRAAPRESTSQTRHLPGMSAT